MNIHEILLEWIIYEHTETDEASSGRKDCFVGEILIPLNLVDAFMCLQMYLRKRICLANSKKRFKKFTVLCRGDWI